MPVSCQYTKLRTDPTTTGSLVVVVAMSATTTSPSVARCTTTIGCCPGTRREGCTWTSIRYNCTVSSYKDLYTILFQVPTCCSCHIMGYSYVYPPLEKGTEQSPASHGPSVSSVSGSTGSSQLNIPPQRPLPTSQDSFHTP